MAVNRDKNGKFLPGTAPPPGVGRRHGSQNKLSANIRETIAARTVSRIDRFYQELDSLTGKEYVTAFLKLLDYFMPRLQALTIDRASTVEELMSLPPVEVAARIRELEKHIGNGKSH